MTKEVLVIPIRLLPFVDWLWILIHFLWRPEWCLRYTGVIGFCVRDALYLAAGYGECDAEAGGPFGHVGGWTPFDKPVIFVGPELRSLEVFHFESNLRIQSVKTMGLLHKPRLSGGTEGAGYLKVCVTLSLRVVRTISG